MLWSKNFSLKKILWLTWVIRLYPIGGELILAWDPNSTCGVSIQRKYSWQLNWFFELFQWNFLWLWKYNIQIFSFIICAWVSFVQKVLFTKEWPYSTFKNTYWRKAIHMPFVSLSSYPINSFKKTPSFNSQSQIFKQFKTNPLLKNIWVVWCKRLVITF